MPEPQVPPPAPAAQTPPSPPATPPTAPPPTPPDEDGDPFKGRLIQDLGLAIGQTPPPPPPPRVQPLTVGEHSRHRDAAEADPQPPAEPPPATPAPAPEAPAAAAAPTPPATPPAAPATPAVSYRQDRDTELARAIGDAVRDAIPKPPPAPAPAPAAPPEEADEVNFSEQQREEMALLRFAAKTNPDKYQNLPGQMKAFYKRVDAYMEAAAKENPERTFGEDDVEFQKFLRQNRPRLTDIERRKIDREMIAADVEAKLEKKHQEKIAALEDKTHRLEAQPRVENTVRAYENQFQTFLKTDTNLTAPILKRVEQVGWDKAVEEDPIFAAPVRAFYRNSVALAQIYSEIAAGVTKYDPKNKDHAFLLEFINHEGARFSQHGGDARVRNGRTFLPRLEYARLRSTDPAKAESQYWTWDDKDVLIALARTTHENMEENIKENEERLRKAGYTRQKPAENPPKPNENIPKTETSTAPTPPTPAPTPQPSPKVGSTAAPGLAKAGKPEQSGAMSDSELDLLVPGRKK